METNDTPTDLLENVVINDVEGTPQYMIQRLPENSQMLSSQLLQHNGLVVDLSGSDYIPVSYSSENMVQHELTEEDRNLAAALVAVQLSQHQKQQQLNESTLPSLSNKILDDQQLILSENLYIDKQTLVKIHSDNVSFSAESFGNEMIGMNKPVEKKKKNQTAVKVRTETRSTKKSLPHKKRISRKLKKNSPQQMAIKCNQCEQTFLSNDEFMEHEILCQTTITPVHATSAFSCQLCDSVFDHQLRFFEHLKSHYEPSASQQRQNTAVQSQQNRLVKNENTESTIINAKTEDVLPNIFTFMCSYCNRSFRKAKTLENHIREVHNRLEQNDEFSETEDLMEGIHVVVEGNDNNLSDSETKTWYREEDLHQTEEDLKELEATEHICHICNQPFPVRAILLQHLVTCRSNTGMNESTAPAVVKKPKKRGNLHCTECDRVFAHRNSLVYHLRSHSGVRPHQCDQCGKSFFASSALKVHLRLHSGDKPYHCGECGKNFRQWGDLKYHMTSLHSNERQFQCEYCGKDFARKYSLIVHRRIHTGEKNYKCEYCNKSFRASSYLQNHRKIHTGEKPHECETCGKPFRVRSDMKRHQKTHHSKRLSAKPLRLPNAQNLIKTNKVEEETVDDVAIAIVPDEAEDEKDAQILAYDEQDPLDTTVRDDNTLYSNGQQLYIVSYSGDIKNVDNSTTWIQTTS